MQKDGTDVLAKSHGQAERGVAWLRTVMQLGLFTFLPINFYVAQDCLVLATSAGLNLVHMNGK